MSLTKDDDVVHYSNSSSQDTTIQYEFVDLGLSIKWATCNIGATKPEEYGWYFQWGGITPYNSDQTPVGGGDPIDFGWNLNCPYWVSGSNEYDVKLLKYTDSDKFSSTNTKDDKLILEPEDDAAHVHISGESRIPTKEEYEELINACNTTWITNYNGTGINGRLFTLKTDPSKTLFFPAAGNLSGTSLNNEGFLSYYWSSSLSDNLASSGHLLFFMAAIEPNISNIYRYCGMPIRAVLPK